MKLNKDKINTVYFVILIFCFIPGVNARNNFVHPGITYTQSDLDRMKAMVDARQEPFYTTFKALVKSGYSVPGNGEYEEITQIPEGGFNGTIGADGRRAHDMALLYHITGDRKYADDAVKRINRYKNLINASCRGTAPLDNGKIFLLIEAAELLRDYDGWLPEDQEAFKVMLTYPFYSTTQSAESYQSLNDADNGVTFYWNIYNLDPGRFGNQGLFAARGLMAMGIYLDNDTIYERGYRYLMNLPHRPDDLPYKSGPPVQNYINSENDYIIDYHVSWGSTIEDYHSDEALQYYIYANGQCQESCRDQGHTMAGIGNYVAIAEIAWNQGDSLYNCLDSRILKGIEYNTRYNLSYVQTYPDQAEAWEPTGFSTNEGDCTFENGIFYQAVSRSKRWEAKNINPDGRGGFGTGGWRAQALAHYSKRMGVSDDQFKWLKRSYDLLMTDYGYENWGEAPNWYYEWTGWGTLTKERTEWMAGDAGTFMDGKRVSCMPEAPCIINAVDYDFFTGNGEGKTYHNERTVLSSLYRNDGTVEITKDGEWYVVSCMEEGEWMSYSLVLPAGIGNTKSAPVKQFNVYVTYKSAGNGALLFAAFNNGEKKGKNLDANETWTEKLLGTFDVTCGAATLKIFVKGQSNLLTLRDIRVTAIEESTIQKINLKDKSTIKVYNADDADVTSSYALAVSKAIDRDKSISISLATQKFMVFDFGQEGININKIALFNDGKIQDTREMASVLGETTDSLYSLSWSQSNKLDFLRTNGTFQSSLYVPVIDNSWVSPDIEGSYSAGPVGKYRYLGIYNWSANFNASEIEVYGVVAEVADNPDAEQSAVWNEGDGETNITTCKVAIHEPELIMTGNEIIIESAKLIVVYNLMGQLINRTDSPDIYLPDGIYILRIKTIDGIFVKKVVVS